MRRRVRLSAATQAAGLTGNAPGSKLLADFKHDRNRHSHVWYRWFNELPVLILIAVVILAVVKPI